MTKRAIPLFATVAFLVFVVALLYYFFGTDHTVMAQYTCPGTCSGPCYSYPCTCYDCAYECDRGLTIGCVCGSVCDTQTCGCYEWHRERLGWFGTPIC